MEVSARQSYFMQEDDEEALSEMEAGSSGNYGNYRNGVVASPFSYTRRNSVGNTNYSYHNNYPQSYYYRQNSAWSPRSVVSGFNNQQQPHFLDSCFLCTKPLDNRDIYMYRGDTPFCSEECRLKEIERDEAKENKQILSYYVKSAMRKRKEQRSSSSSSSSSTRDYAFHNGTVAAA